LVSLDKKSLSMALEQSGYAYSPNRAIPSQGPQYSSQSQKQKAQRKVMFRREVLVKTCSNEARNEEDSEHENNETTEANIDQATEREHESGGFRDQCRSFRRLVSVFHSPKVYSKGVNEVKDRVKGKGTPFVRRTSFLENTDTDLLMEEKKEEEEERSWKEKASESSQKEDLLMNIVEYDEDNDDVDEEFDDIDTCNNENDDALNDSMKREEADRKSTKWVLTEERDGKRSDSDYLSSKTFGRYDSLITLQTKTQATSCSPRKRLSSEQRTSRGDTPYVNRYPVGMIEITPVRRSCRVGGPKALNLHLTPCCVYTPNRFLPELADYLLPEILQLQQLQGEQQHQQYKPHSLGDQDNH